MALPHLRAARGRRRAGRPDPPLAHGVDGVGAASAAAGTTGRDRVEGLGPLGDGVRPDPPARACPAARRRAWSSRPPRARAASPSRRRPRDWRGRARSRAGAASRATRAGSRRPAWSRGSGRPRRLSSRAGERPPSVSPASGRSAATIACHVEATSWRRRRLHERERVPGQERPAQGDLGGDAGRRVRTPRPASRGMRRPTTASGGEAVAPRERDREQLQRERPAGARRGIGRHAGGEVRATMSGPAGTRTWVPARASSRWANTWSAMARSGSTRPATISRIGSAMTMSIRSKAATTAWSGAASAGASVMMPDVAATARARLVDEPAQDRRARAGRRSGSAGPTGRTCPGRRATTGVPASAARARRTARCGRRARGWAGRPPGPARRRRRSRPEPRRGRRRSPRDPRPVPTHGRGGSPSTASSSRRAVRFASMRSIAARASAAASAIATARRSDSREELRLEPEVHVPRRDRQRELLRREVVLRQRHRERERDPAAEAARVGGEVAVDDLGRERTAVAVEPADAEQAQDRPLLPDRGGRRGTASPGDRELGRPGEQGLEVGGLRQLLHGRQYAGDPRAARAAVSPSAARQRSARRARPRRGRR